MSNPKKHASQFQPSHLGTQPRKAGGNKGAQMQDKTDQQPDVIQTKGH
ncbi:acid-soluble spore protein N [Aureibacillus halotolerans]|uniref:Small, acid-soluble spore protein N n=1 Tax=Aureibacillus halotolerans TaxID=1508390 RepID=A0A4R6U1A2_9BACI|nr:acid-soluble spore protein N [Aureibacillus halotolerans]TDQ39751.1 small acid-soluble spore protein N (minor) [Aureibacillus halotolerans]